jgi:hypothetical protein
MHMLQIIAVKKQILHKNAIFRFHIHNYSVTDMQMQLGYEFHHPNDIVIRVHFLIVLTCVEVLKIVIDVLDYYCYHS